MTAPVEQPAPFRRKVLAALVAVVAVLTPACGGEAPEDEEAPAAAEPTPAADAGPRVFFVQPTEGATVTNPVEIVFGSEGTEIGAVPPEVETPREGIVHYHLGYDTDCLAPGTVIPQADPWIHFGDGSDRIEFDFPGPGTHRLTVQAGDDQHRTIAGLCETIEVTVEGAAP